jgi:hypothetical protein
MSIAANKVRECAGIAQENMQKACISSLSAGSLVSKNRKQEMTEKKSETVLQNNPCN